MTSSRPQTLNKKELRRHFRSRRRDLSVQERVHAAKATAQALIKLPEYQQAQHIGVYSAMPEEIPLDPLVLIARQDNKNLYLPLIDKIDHENRMHYKAWTADDVLYQNRHGISEPRDRKFADVEPELDLVLMPIVAFDQSGHRLGMGGGYYDRYFAKHDQEVMALKEQTSTTPMVNHSHTCFRIGIAHSCQLSSHLPFDNWDIDLHAAITEKSYYDFR